MKKRLLSMFLVFTLVFSVIPAFGNTVMAMEDGWYIVKKMNSFIARMNTSGTILDYTLNFTCDVDRGNRIVMLMSVPEQYADTLTADETFGMDNLSDYSQYKLPTDPNTHFIKGTLNPSNYEGVLSNEVSGNFPVSNNITVKFTSMKLYSDNSKGLDTGRSYAVFFVLRTPWDGSRIFRNTGYNNLPVATLLPVSVTLKKQNIDGTYTDTVVKTHVVEGSNLTYDAWPVADIAGSGYFINTAKSVGAGTVTAQTDVGSKAKSDRKAQDVVIYYDLVKTEVAAVTCAGESVWFDTLQSALDAAESGDTLTLIADTTENVVIPAGKDITLDLNGYVLKGTGSGSVVTVEAGAKLTIEDSGSDAKHYYTVKDASLSGNGAVTVSGKWELNAKATSGTSYDDLTQLPANGTTILVPGGAITGGTGTDLGSEGCVYTVGGAILNFGSTTIKGGNIIGNQSWRGAIMTMSGSQATEGSQAQETPEDGQLFVNSGRIAGNTGDYSSAVCIGLDNAEDNPYDETSGGCTMNGGEIAFNTGINFGAVQVFNGSFTMNDGAISHNKGTDTQVRSAAVTTYGSNHEINTISLLGGEISENEYKSGGVYGCCDDLTVGGTIEISDNTNANLYLPSGYTAAISTEKAPTTMSVGVTLEDGSGDVTSAASSNYTDCFTSDGDYKVFHKGSGSKQKIFLAVPEAKAVTSGGAVTYYATLVDAGLDAPDGSTIYVLKDLSGFEKGQLQFTHDCTVDLNAHTLSGEDVVYASQGATVTVKNGTISSAGNSSCVGVYNSGTLYVEDVTLTGDNVFYGTGGHTYFLKGVTADANALYSTNGNAALHIMDGTYAIDRLEYNNGAIDRSVLFLSGGCFLYEKSSLEAYISSVSKVIDCTHSKSGCYDVITDDSLAVTEVQCSTASSEIVTKFASLQEALNAANTGNTVVMLKDTAAEITIASGKDIILDLNGKMLKAPGKDRRPLTVNGTLTIIDSDAEAVHYFTKEDLDASAATRNIYRLSETATQTVVKGGIIYGGYHEYSGSDYGGGNVIINSGGLLKMTAGSVVGGLSGAQAGGVSIVPGGTLELSGTANIEGNSSAYGGGFSNWGTVKMSGGTVQNNSGLTCSSVINYGTFEMTAGSIQNNTSTGDYPIQLWGKTTLLGGEITGNNSTGENGKGGIVWGNEALVLGGTIQITDNLNCDGSRNNLRCESAKPITISSASSPSTMLVGITSKTAPTKNSNVKITGAGKSDYSSHFTSDNADYKIYSTGSGSSKTVVLSVHEHTWEYGGSGNTLKAWCNDSFGAANCDYYGESKAVTVSLEAPADGQYSGEGKNAAFSDDELQEYSLSVEDIKYYVKGKTSAMTGAPVNVGTYVAEYTLPGTSISVTREFNITKAAPKADEFICNAPDMTYDGSAKTATVTAKSSVTGMGPCTVEYYDGETKLAEAPTKAGTYNIKAVVAEGSNYTSSSAVTAAEWTLTINPKTVTVSGTTVADKVYDATCTAISMAGALEGILGNDQVTVTSSATFEDKNVGTDKTVNITYTLDGADAANYTAEDGTASAEITPAVVSAKWTGISKVYNGSAQVPVASMAGVYEGDVVSAAFSAFNTKTDAGSYQLTAGLLGKDAANYTLTNPNVNFVIEKSPVTFTVTDAVQLADGTPKTANICAVDGSGKPVHDYEITYKDYAGEAVDPAKSGRYGIYATLTGSAIANYRHTGAADGSQRRIGTLVLYSGSAPASGEVSFGAAGIASITGLWSGDEVTLPECTISNPGYIFAGWTVNGKLYKAGETFTMPSGNISFVPMWTRDVRTVGGTICGPDGITPLKDAVITLMSGSRKVCQVVTGSDGKYQLPDILPGCYNLVVSYDGVTVTTAVEIADQNLNISSVLPAGRTNSVVEVAAGSPEITVSGLEKSFEDTEGNYTPADEVLVNDGGSVEFKLSVKEEGAPDQKKAAELDTKTSNELLCLDFNLSKTTIDKLNQKVSTTLYETDELLEITIAIPAEMQGMDSYQIFRYHSPDGTADNETLTEMTLLTDAADGEEGFVVSDDKTAITVYTRCFSLYAITYQNKTSSGYTITGNAPENGSVTLSGQRGRAGKTITIHVAPAEGYILSTLIVKDNRGKVLDLTVVEENEIYCFRMPAAKVFIYAGFAVKSEICQQDENCVYDKFADTNTKAWYHDGVHFCVDRGYMVGMSDDLFVPAGSLTRAQMVTLLWNMEGQPVVDCDMSFEDVAEDLWYTEPIRWAQSTGVVVGHSEERFAPEDTVTREQVAAILMNYARFRKCDISVGEFIDLLGYDDASDGISWWALSSMKWAVGTGIISGVDNKLMAMSDATRVQAACMIQHFCENVLGEE